MWNDDLYEVAALVGIKKENIHFTAYQDKIEFLRGKGFRFHLDDDYIELMMILEDGDPCQPLNVDFDGWQIELTKIMKEDVEQ